MHILFVNSRKDANQNPGGDNIQLQKTKAALEARGVKVTIKEPDTLTQLPSFDVAHVFNIQMPESAWQVFKDLKKFKKPIVLSSIYWDLLENWSDTAVSERARWQTVAATLGRERTKSLYIRWQNLKEPLFARWRLRRRLLHQAVRVLPNSQSEADLLQSTFALGNNFQKRVNVVPNGIDVDLYHDLPTPNTRFLEEAALKEFVLQVGSINPIKNQLGLIKALYDLSIPIVFIGKPLTARLDYFELCQQLGEERGNVYFVNRVPYEELPGIYARAAVHVLPSWRETPGLVSLEAAAAGCKIVTTSIGSTKDYFGEFAWYCYPSDQDSIRQAVESALQSPNSPLLRQCVLEKYTWDQAALASLAAYKSALGAYG